MTEPTFCDACDHAIRRLDGSKTELPAYRWLCMARPRDDAKNFVSRTMRLAEPYYRCADVNDGDCTRFNPLREATNDRA